MNLYAMLDDAIRRHGGRPAISYGGGTITFTEFDRMAGGLASQLAGLGCRPGDRVVIFLKNCFEYAPLLLGAIRAGFVVVPVNAKLHPSEVAWICGNAQPRVVVADREAVAAIETHLKEGTRPKLVTVEELEPAATDDSPTAEVEPDDPAWIFYTSGTTGKPKGAVLSHRNLIAATVNCLADILNFRGDDTVLHVAPLSHGSGLYLIPALSRGAHNIISDRPNFQPDEVLDIVAERRVTAIAFVAPTMIARLLDARPREDIGHLRGVIYGGSTIHLEHIRAAVKRFGPIFHQLYGQGEAPMTISGLPARDHEAADNETLLSAGNVRAGVEVRIVDERGEPVARGEEGEICVRGDVVMTSYWRNPEATQAALKGGWLHTGDIGRFDDGGRLRVLDRRHDTIISGGTNIYPKEIEDVIAAHAGVKEVVAFGLDDREWGEIVAVAIVAKPGAAGLDYKAIAEFCRERLASFKKPRRVFFVEELPKNAYGKVLRREIRSGFQAV